MRISNLFKTLFNQAMVFNNQLTDPLSVKYSLQITVKEVIDNS